VRRTQPAAYLKILALLVPREHKVEHRNPLKELTDEQLEAMIEHHAPSIPRNRPTRVPERLSCWSANAFCEEGVRTTEKRIPDLPGGRTYIASLLDHVEDNHGNRQANLSLVSLSF
jgi:hypothetical protein